MPLPGDLGVAADQRGPGPAADVLRFWPSDSLRARPACVRAMVSESRPSSSRRASAHACSLVSRLITCNRMPNVGWRLWAGATN